MFRVYTCVIINFYYHTYTNSIVVVSVSELITVEMSKFLALYSLLVSTSFSCNNSNTRLIYYVKRDVLLFKVTFNNKIRYIDSKKNVDTISLYNNNIKLQYRRSFTTTLGGNFVPN